jgi:hypothetical protein
MTTNDNKQGSQMTLMTENVQIILTSLALLAVGMSLFIAGVYAVVRHKEAKEQQRVLRERLLGQ